MWAIDYWALASALAGTLLIAIMTWIALQDPTPGSTFVWPFLY
jgi:hypothetical protein